MTLTWGPNSPASQTAQVVIKNDDHCEPTETFNVFLTNADGATLGMECSSLVTIYDDDCKFILFMGYFFYLGHYIEYENHTN